MKAITFDRYGGPENLAVADLPSPVPDVGEVVVKVHSAGINPLDTYIRKGSLKAIIRLKMPAIVGSDFSGVIEEVGAGVEKFRPGDAVFGATQIEKGEGAYAEFAKASEDEITHKPDGLSFEEAAALPVAGLTAYQGLAAHGKVSSGSNVLILGGSGGVGSFAIQIGKILGAHVTAVCSSKHRDYVMDLGADTFLDYETENPYLSEKPYDTVFDCVGKYEFAKMKPVMAPNSVYVTTDPSPLNLMLQFVTSIDEKKHKIMMVDRNQQNLADLAKLYEGGKLRVPIDRVFTPEESVEAHRMMEEGHVAGKLVIRMS
ncbi:MAG: NAD(P)-dependent alcohol dehydrogenase [Fimbriimonadaceae bacterium]